MMISLPEKIESIWMGTTPETNYTVLKEDLEMDVIIIGGGIAGLMAAYFLKRQGLKVGLLEMGKIASSTSGNTTAKVTSLHGLRYAYLLEKFGKAGAQIYADSHQWAVSELENIIKKEKINCDFYQAPSFTYTKSDEDLEKIKQEAQAALQLNLPASFVTSIPGATFPISGAVRFDSQAYFHPRKYLLRIADLVEGEGSHVWENSQVLNLTEERDFCQLKTSKAVVRAKNVIVATNFPFYDPHKIFSKLQRLGSFVIAASPASDFPEAMFIGTKSLDLSFRPQKDKTKDWLIIGARHEEAPQGKDMNESFKLLAELANKNFQIKSIDYKWGAADTYSLDKVAYIGRMPKSEKVYVATGFSAWGMTTSVVAAKILTDLILEKKNDWQSLYDPKRIMK